MKREANYETHQSDNAANIQMGTSRIWINKYDYILRTINFNAKYKEK